MEYENSETFARDADNHDELAGFRKRFSIPIHKDEDAVYLVGNSLGLMPEVARNAVQNELDSWAQLGVDGHFKDQHPWYSYHEELRAAGASLVGAKPSEVVFMNGLTVNLHLMMVSFFRPGGRRNKILIESGAFPSDLYSVQSQLHWHGLDRDKDLIQVQPSLASEGVTSEDIVAAIEDQGDEIALVLVGAVNFFTGRLYDMAEITRAGQAAGCLVGFDLAHSAGNVPHSLHDWGVDFAAWCTYKYLNSGPGAVAGCFVHERHHADDRLPQFGGWWGNDPDTRFDMNAERDFAPVSSADRWQMSNPPILAMAPVRESLNIFEEAGIENIRNKSIEMTGYLSFLVDELGSENVEVLTPDDPRKRGSQLSLRIGRDPVGLFKSLSAKGVATDLRKPDVIRVAPAPLYNSFHDVWRFASILRETLDD